MQPDTVYRRGGSSGYDNYAPPPDYTDPPQRDPVLFPPRFGLVHTIPTIMDVLRTNRLYPNAASATSGYPRDGYSGTARPGTSLW